MHGPPMPYTENCSWSPACSGWTGTCYYDFAAYCTGYGTPYSCCADEFDNYFTYNSDDCAPP